MTKGKYYYAYDPIIKKRVVHVRVGNRFISLITEHEFEDGGKD